MNKKPWKLITSPLLPYLSIHSFIYSTMLKKYLCVSDKDRYNTSAFEEFLLYIHDQINERMSEHRGLFLMGCLRKSLFKKWHWAKSGMPKKTHDLLRNVVQGEIFQEEGMSTALTLGETKLVILVARDMPLLIRCGEAEVVKLGIGDRQS